MKYRVSQKKLNPFSIAYYYKTIQPVKAFLYPRYEVYRGYIVFAFSVIMFFVCLSVCL